MLTENFSDKSENSKAKISIQSETPAQIQEYLAELAVPDPSERRTALRNVLVRAGLDYTIQGIDPTVEKPLGIENYLVKIGPESAAPHLLFCAHYDSFPASCGANDNSAAVCILIELAKELKKRAGFSAEFAFFDGEETKHSGSKLYVNEFDKNSISAVINLDICGYGDTIAVYSHNNPEKEAIRNFCSKAILNRHNGQLVKFLPESDDIAFSGKRLPVLNIAIMPKWDTQYLTALASYNNGILGKPPEFEMIMGQMEVITTMHGSFRDKVDAVQPDAMQQMYDYVLDAVTAPLQSKKLFHLF